MPRMLTRALVAIASTVGLVLTGTVVPAQAATVTVTATLSGPQTVLVGERTSLAVTYRRGGEPVASGTLFLQRRVGTRWVAAGSVAVREGRGTRALAPTRTTVYRVTTYGAARASRGVTVRAVKPALGVRLSGPSVLDPGERSQLSLTYGALGRTVPFTRMALQRRVDGRWVTATPIGVRHGRATVGLAPARTTTYRVKALDGSGTVSGGLTVRVLNPLDMPDGVTHVGVPTGTTLRRHDGDLTITRDGTVVSGLDIRGFVRIKADDVVIKNSVVRGPATALTYPMALVQADAGSDGNILIQDTTIYAQKPSRFVDGVVGMGFTLRRVDVHTVVDQVKVIGSNVLVDTSRLHDNLFYRASGSHKETHDDNVQVQVGSNVRVVNSSLTGATNAAVMITQDRGRVTNFRMVDSKADEGACTINVAEKSYGAPSGLTISGNLFGTGQRHDRCAILLSPSTQRVASVSRNVFVDGDSVPVSRGA